MLNNMLRLAVILYGMVTLISAFSSISFYYQGKKYEDLSNLHHAAKHLNVCLFCGIMFIFFYIIYVNNLLTY